MKVSAQSARSSVRLPFAVSLRCVAVLERGVALRRGVTLIEVLVVIAIIGVLVAILLPGVQSARESARRSACQSHLRQLALGLHSYHASHDMFPAGSYAVGPSFEVESGWGWQAMILPFLEANEIYEQIDFGLPTAVGSNRSVIDEIVSISYCPSDITPPRVTVHHPFSIEPDVVVAAGNYLGVEPILGEFTTTSLADIVDGASSTLLLGEQRYSYDATYDESSTNAWCGIVTFADTITTDSIVHQRANTFTQINNFGSGARTFSSRHPGGASFAFADGHVKLLSNNIDVDTYAGLGTANGDELIEF